MYVSDKRGKNGCYQEPTGITRSGRRRANKPTQFLNLLDSRLKILSQAIPVFLWSLKRCAVMEREKKLSRDRG